jgi:hypothetical protein
MIVPPGKNPSIPGQSTLMEEGFRNPNIYPKKMTTSEVLVRETTSPFLRGVVVSSSILKAGLSALSLPDLEDERSDSSLSVLSHPEIDHWSETPILPQDLPLSLAHTLVSC